MKAWEKKPRMGAAFKRRHIVRHAHREWQIVRILAEEVRREIDEAIIRQILEAAGVER